MEHLREELPSMLVGVGQPVSAAMRAYLNDAPAQNVSGYRLYTQYYSSELRDWSHNATLKSSSVTATAGKPERATLPQCP